MRSTDVGHESAARWSLRHRTRNSRVGGVVSARESRTGCPVLRTLSAGETREREPHVRCVASVLVPEEGIVDYPAVCEALVDRIGSLGGEVRVNAGVESIAAVA